jgi:hypothetical protein
LGRVDRYVDVAFTTLGHDGQQRSVVGVEDVDCRAVGGVDELTVNEQPAGQHAGLKT